MGQNTRAEEAALPVIIYTSFRIVTGVLHLPPPMRLSDRLNTSKDDFLPLRDPRIIDLQRGWVEPVAEAGPWFIHRQEILVLHEISTPISRVRVVGIPEERIPKRLTLIRAYVGVFRVEGKLHLPPEADIPTYLNQTKGIFLPLTSVMISLPGREELDVVQAPFALVNRRRLTISSQGNSSRERNSPL